MTTAPTSKARGRLRLAALVAALLAGALLAAREAGLALIIKKAADIPNKAEGLGKFVSATKELLDPAMVMVAAATPLVVIAGLGLMALGRPKGLVIAGSAAATLVLVGSANGIVA